MVLECARKNRDWRSIINKFSYLWDVNKFIVIKKPKFWKAVFVIYILSGDPIGQKITSIILTAYEPTKDHVIMTLKKLVDKRVLEKFHSLRVERNQLGFSDTEIEKEGIKFWLEYNNIDPHLKNLVVFNVEKKELIERIPLC
jgi:hypothetical protein|tara:strand:- start:48 stop:473 length:426 start_codon:yes stop_codon:yes gene_type:complete